MLTRASLVAFVTSSDLGRSRRFYADVLGLAVEAEDSFGLMLAAGGGTLRVSLVEQPVIVASTVVGWTVPDIEAELTALGERGVAFTRYPDMEQDPRGVWTAPGGALVAWFTDPDGNVLSLTELP